MAARDDADLIALFLEEAGERLERVIELVGRIGTDDGAVVGLRRELHALKGASRMMGLGEISDLCHRAEDLAAVDAVSHQDELASCCAGIATMVESLSGGGPGAGRRALPSPIGDRPQKGGVPRGKIYGSGPGWSTILPTGAPGCG